MSSMGRNLVQKPSTSLKSLSSSFFIMSSPRTRNLYIFLKTMRYHADRWRVYREGASWQGGGADDQPQGLRGVPARARELRRGERTPLQGPGDAQVLLPERDAGAGVRGPWPGEGQGGAEGPGEGDRVQLRD